MGFASHLSLVQVLVLFPLGVALHVAEEWPGFPRWARRFASAQYSDREYITTHVVAVVLAIGAVGAVRWLPTTPVLFGFLAVVFGPGVFCNAWFHIGGTVLSRTYCPGVITASWCTCRCLSWSSFPACGTVSLRHASYWPRSQSPRSSTHWRSVTTCSSDGRARGSNSSRRRDRSRRRIRR
jgi:hypothetical protein